MPVCLITEDWQEYISVYDLWRAVAVSPSVNSLNSTSQSPFS